MWKKTIYIVFKKRENIQGLYVQYPSRLSDRFHFIFRLDSKIDFSLSNSNAQILLKENSAGSWTEERMVRGAYTRTVIRLMLKHRLMGCPQYLKGADWSPDKEQVSWCHVAMSESGDQEDPASKR